MLCEKRQALAVIVRGAAEQEANRLVIIGAVLLVVHLLDIKPNDVDMLGLKFSVSNPVILRGSISAVFLHTLHMFTFNMISLSSLDRSIDLNRQIGRYLIKKHQKKGRSIKKAKLISKSHSALNNLMFAPYAIIFSALLAAAIVVSFYDLWMFFVYCFEHTSAGLFFQKLIA